MKKLLCVSSLLTLFCCQAYAFKEIPILGQDGKTMIVLGVAEEGEEFDGRRAYGTLPEEVLRCVEKSFNFFARFVLKNIRSPSNPCRISVGFTDSLSSRMATKFGKDGLTKVARAILGLECSDEIHGTLFVASNSLKVLGTSHKSMVACFFHEIMHLLGISHPVTPVNIICGTEIVEEPDVRGFVRSGSVEVVQMDDGYFLEVVEVEAAPFFRQKESQGLVSVMEAERRLLVCPNYKTGSLPVFYKHLVDSFGQPARENMKIVKSDFKCEDKFCINSSNFAYFQGPTVMSLLGQTISRGLPVRGEVSDLCHLEGPRFLMSHQRFVSRHFFSALEFAVLQDVFVLPHDQSDPCVDHRHFWGHSIYSCGRTHHLSSPDCSFFKKDFPFTTGLEICFGASDNKVMLMDGYRTRQLGGECTGVYLDGFRNSVIVKKGAEIILEGTDATGISASYGINNVCTVEGVVKSLGNGGVAVKADFGSNNSTGNAELRGSYICRHASFEEEEGFSGQLASEDIQVPDELKGPVVECLTISGTVQGQKAAVYISSNAFVKTINISGGEVIGDMVSYWNPGAEFVQFDEPDDLRTKICFLTCSSLNGNIRGYGRSLMVSLGKDCILSLLAPETEMTNLVSFVMDAGSCIHIPRKLSIMADEVIFMSNSKIEVEFDQCHEIRKSFLNIETKPDTALTKDSFETLKFSYKGSCFKPKVEIIEKGEGFKIFSFFVPDTSVDPL